MIVLLTHCNNDADDLSVSRFLLTSASKMLILCFRYLYLYHAANPILKYEPTIHSDNTKGARDARYILAIACNIWTGHTFRDQISEKKEIHKRLCSMCMKKGHSRQAILNAIQPITRIIEQTNQHNKYE